MVLFYSIFINQTTDTQHVDVKLTRLAAKVHNTSDSGLASIYYSPNGQLDSIPRGGGGVCMTLRRRRVFDAR